VVNDTEVGERQRTMDGEGGRTVLELAVVGPFEPHQPVGEHLEIVTSRFRLTYDKGPFTASGLSLAVGGGVSAYHSVWRYGQEVQGLGGTARTLDGADGPVPLEPGVVSRSGFAVIDDSTSLVFDADGWVAPRDGERTDLYVFAYGHDYAEALRAFYTVSGPVPVLPRFTLGNWWSRYHRYSADNYRELIQRFREEGIPFSVSVIDMDWHLVDIPAHHGSGWTGYTWNRELFPDPAAFLGWLHENGLRVTLNVHPADGVRAFEDAYPAMAEALGRDAATGDPIVFDVTDRAFLQAYFEVLHRRLEADGVDFWWLDWQSGPHSKVAGIDPLWMLNHFHFLDNGRDGRRAVTLSRNAGPGSHRYPIGFSGDTVISWASLQFQPHFTASAATIGYGWWSHDIGGHFQGSRDDELTTRWVQFGTFSPIMRLHSGAHTFITKEPWTFSTDARAVMTSFLRLRHRLVPYLHTMNHRAATDGLPLVLPMYFAFPHAEEAYSVPNQYAFGTELVVAPITEPADPCTGLGRVRAWLPDGLWVDLLTDVVYDGGRETYLHRDLTTIPVLARAGGIVPLDAALVGNDLPNPVHLEVMVVVGSDGRFELVEDDDTRAGDLARTPIAFDQATGTLEIGRPRGAPDVIPAVRSWTLTFPALSDEVTPAASVDGRPVQARLRRESTRTSVTVEDVPRSACLRMDLGADPQLRDNDVHNRLFRVLDRAQTKYAIKTRVMAIATADRPLAVRLAHLEALDLEPALATAINEILLARTTG